MLRRFHTAVLEKNETYGEDFDTEPMECGWAGEATWFLRVVELDAGTTFRCGRSPDGVRQGAAREAHDLPGAQGIAGRDYQRSRSRPGTRRNSPRFRVTSVMAPASAIDAIIRSFPPIGRPSRRSWARIVPYCVAA